MLLTSQQHVHTFRLHCGSRNRSVILVAACRALEDALYTSPIAIQRIIGPVRVVQLQGKGRGVVATKDILPGELLLLVPPLALLEAAPGVQQRPHPAGLVDRLLQGPAAHGQWLEILYDGTSKSTRTLQDLVAPEQPHGAPSAQQAAAQPQQASEGAARDDSPQSDAPSASQPAPGALAPATAARQRLQVKRSSSGRGHAAGGAPKQQAAEARQLGKRAAKVIAFNAFGDEHDDLAAAAVAGAEPRGSVGVWREMAMLNHSCAPNAINWVAPGGRMVVRAVRRIKQGQEVTISYMGKQQLHPVEQRQAFLRNAYMFKCACERCAAEAALVSKSAGAMAAAVHATAVDELRALLDKALAEQDARCMQEARVEAQALLTTLYGEMRRCVVAPAGRLWLQASCYECAQVVADADAALGDVEALEGSLAACLRAAEAVTPGSDLHCTLAAQRLHAVRKLQESAPQGATDDGGGEVIRAQQQCAMAHQLRYGRLSPPLLDRMIELNRTLYV